MKKVLWLILLATALCVLTTAGMVGCDKGDVSDETPSNTDLGTSNSEETEPETAQVESVPDYAVETKADTAAETKADQAVETAPITVHQHTSVTDARVEPTCTADGLTEGSHCAECGEVLTAQEPLPATGHTEVIDNGKKPTCTKDGLTEGSHCSVCGETTTAQQTISATGHDEVTDNAKEATCSKDGLTEGSHCATCGEVLVKQNTIAATGAHRYNSGGSCKKCGASMPPPTEGLSYHQAWLTMGKSELEVVAYGSASNTLGTILVIPDTHNGLPVVSIGWNAFVFQSDLKIAIIPSSIINIEASAFSLCSDLKSLTYLGTVSQWNAIDKDPDWNEYSEITIVYCTDGTVEV